MSEKITESKKYSVLMSLYKKEKPEYLAQAIDSMITQTLPPSEIIIVKDGTLPEALLDVLKEYQNRYPSVFIIAGYDDNRGLGKALNYGLQYCKNDLVARMDTDDISKPNRCEKEIDFLTSHPEISFVGSWVDEFSNSTDNIISTRRVPTDYKDIYDFCKRRNPFNHPTVVFRKQALIDVEGYSDLRYGQDYELFGRMMIKGLRAANIPESLLFFRTGNDALKRRKNKQSIRSYIETVKDFKKQGYSGWSDVLYVEITQSLLAILPNGVTKKIYKIVRGKN